MKKQTIKTLKKIRNKEWLKSAAYLDTKDKNAIKYIFVRPKQKLENKIPYDSGHFIRSEIDEADLRKSNLGTKITAKNIVKKYRNISRKTPYIKSGKEKI